MVPVDSTTIYRPLSEHPAPGVLNGPVGEYGPSIPGVPTNLLTGSYGGGDYAGTYIGNDTVRKFPYTDLVITQPTPYDVWMRIGIYTETPNASVHASSDFSVWPPSVCGTYSTSTEYSYSSWTVDTGGTKSVVRSSSPIATHTELQPSDPKNQLRFILADPIDGDYTDRLNTLNATYIQAKTTQFTEERLMVPLPTDIVDWLATQEQVIKEYPYIKNCWLGPKGTGQPTVHVPVMALTVTSSVFLDRTETPTAKSSKEKSTLTRSMTRTIHTIVTVMSSEGSQQTTQVRPAAVNPSTAHEERPAESVTGFAIGTQTASLGGSAVTHAGSVYYALPSGSGLRIVPDGVTTSGNSYMASATNDSLSVASNDTINATAATFNSETVSSNSTRSVQATETSASTIGLGDAIISGIGGGVADGAGGENTSDPEESTSAAVVSDAPQRSAHLLLGSISTFAFALALL